MNDQQIPFSHVALRQRLIFGAVVIGFICVLSTVFFSYMWFAPNLQRILIIIIWTLLPLAWVVGALLENMRITKTKYILSDDALRKEKKGWFGSSTKQLYRYDAIDSVSSKSRGNGKYGSVELVYDQHNSLVLSGIENPDKYAGEIKKRAGNARSSVRVDYARPSNS